jgi:hypothetical protein
MNAIPRPSDTSDSALSETEQSESVSGICMDCERWDSALVDGVICLECAERGERNKKLVCEECE